MIIRVSPDRTNLCMVRPAIGDFVVNRNYRLTPSGLAILVLSAAALALGGCGRKAGLDLPPNAMNSSSAVADPDSDAERANQPSVYNPDLRLGAAGLPPPKAARNRLFSTRCSATKFQTP